MAATAIQTQPGLPSRPLPTYKQVKESTFELDWADLVTLDLSLFDQAGGKERLAHQLRDAVHNVGFFYITNFGLTQAEVNEQFAIGKEIFSMPLEEKLKYRADLEHGHYSGYKPAGTNEVLPGLRDNFEMYNLFKLIPELERTQPPVVNENRPIIEKFQKHIATSIVPKLLALIAIVLEMPENSLKEGHEFKDISDCHLRYMIYRARTPEENAKYQGLYSKGHSDFGSLTLLFRQPIAALQIRTTAGEWKWVKPYPESITVNIADVLQFWSNGYLKSSIHRVVAPPPDQAHLDRLGLLYFLRPSHDLNLQTLDSPLLKRLGLRGSDDEEARSALKAVDWVRARVKGNLDKVDNNTGADGVREKAVIGGVKAKYYD